MLLKICTPIIHTAFEIRIENLGGGHHRSRRRIYCNGLSELITATEEASGQLGGNSAADAHEMLMGKDVVK